MTVTTSFAAFVSAILVLTTASLAVATPYSFTANYANCPDNCGASLGAGSCQGGTCKCSPGHGGISCSFRAETLYGTPLDSIYSGVIPRRNGSRPADAATSRLDRLFQAGGPPPQLVIMAGADRTSALAWGRRLQSQGGGALLSVDDWLPPWHLTLGSSSATLPWRNPRLAEDAETGTPRSAAVSASAISMASFMSTVAGAGLQPWVIPMQAPLHLACQVLGSLSVKADVVHFTSQGLRGYGMNHQWTQWLQECWWPIVAPGGLLLIDTPHPSSGGSSDPLAPADHTSAITEFARRHNATLHPASAASPQWILAKPLNTADGPAASQSANTAAADLSASSSVDAAAGTGASAGAQAPCDPALAVLPDGWQPCSMGGRIRVDVQGRTVRASFVSFGPWGNLLAPYFQGLAIAQLLNYTYMYDSGFAEDWLAHLPNRVEPGLVCPNVTEVVHACATCTRHDLWEFTMNCPAGWPKARAAIRNVTRGALETWAKANGKVLPQFQEAEAVIQIRCARDALLAHDIYGPTAFSYFTTHMPKSTKRVNILYARHGHHSPKNYEPCERLVTALENYIREKRPDVEVLVVGGEKWEDWSRLVYAPVAFRECQSSWGLWSIMAGDGLAFSPPLFSAEDKSDKRLEFVSPYVDGKFQFVQGAVLYPEVARRANITTCGEDARTCDLTPQADTIVAWLREH